MAVTQGGASPHNPGAGSSDPGGLQGATGPANGPDTTVVTDPLGLTPLLQKRDTILTKSGMDPRIASDLKDRLPTDILVAGDPNLGVNPNNLARLMVQSPVVMELLARRSRSTMVHGGALAQEDYNLLGAIHAYTEIQVRDKLMAANLVMLHAGEHGVDEQDLARKLELVYKEMAAEPRSIIKPLLLNELDDSHDTGTTAIVAGMLAPLIVMRHRVVTPEPESGGIVKLLGRLAGAGRKETPVQLADLGLIEEIRPEDATLLKELSATRTKAAVSGPAVTYSDPDAVDRTVRRRPEPTPPPARPTPPAVTPQASQKPPSASPFVVRPSGTRPPSGSSSSPSAARIGGDRKVAGPGGAVGEAKIGSGSKNTTSSIKPASGIGGASKIQPAKKDEPTGTGNAKIGSPGATNDGSGSAPVKKANIGGGDQADSSSANTSGTGRARIGSGADQDDTQEKTKEAPEVKKPGPLKNVKEAKIGKKKS